MTIIVSITNLINELLDWIKMYVKNGHDSTMMGSGPGMAVLDLVHGPRP